VGASPRTRKTAGGKRPRRQVQLPSKYSHAYPVRTGHDYVLNSIPVDVWRRAKKRAHAEDRSVRVVLIRALELYGSGRIPL
jgi:hypothetical protein